MEDKKIPLIAVVGPTASGKTALGIALAKALSGDLYALGSLTKMLKIKEALFWYPPSITDFP